MPNKKRPVVITPTARRKLTDIAKWSAQTWGKKTAREYMGNLKKVIQSVADGSLPCQDNPEFSIRFSYYLAKRHYIFFEFHDDKVVVATVFHTAMHIKERLKEESLSIRKEINNIK